MKTTFDNNPNAALEQLCDELWAIAEYLDAVDAGLVAPDPLKYQKLARRATVILATESCIEIAKCCDGSWALADIRENLFFAQGVTLS